MLAGDRPIILLQNKVMRTNLFLFEVARLTMFNAVPTTGHRTRINPHMCTTHASKLCHLLSCGWNILLLV